MNNDLTITQQIEQIAGDICDNYCKFPAMYDGDEDMDRLIEERCNACPLCKLL